MFAIRWLAAAALLVCGLTVVPELSGSQDAAILQIRVLEGEGLVHSVGTRAIKPLSVQITDETGKPAEGVAVSFRLPEEGASGRFGNGLRSDIVTTNSEGKAVAWGVEWGKGAGSVEIRITAAKGEARAGTVVAQYLTEPTAANHMKAKSDADAARRVAASTGKSRAKWITLTALVAGAAAGGVAAAAGASKSPNTIAAAPTPAAAPAQPSSPTFSIGAPVVVVGRPK